MWQYHMTPQVKLSRRQSCSTKCYALEKLRATPRLRSNNISHQSPTQLNHPPNPCPTARRQPSSPSLLSLSALARPWLRDHGVFKAFQSFRCAKSCETSRKVTLQRGPMTAISGRSLLQPNLGRVSEAMNCGGEEGNIRVAKPFVFLPLSVVPKPESQDPCRVERNLQTLPPHNRSQKPQPLRRRDTCLIQLQIFYQRSQRTGLDDPRRARPAAAPSTP